MSKEAEPSRVSSSQMASPQNRRRRSREGGAALVEFALIAPLFIMLVFGMIDFANTFNDYNSVRQGVREGARQAVVASWTDTGCTTGTSSARVACVTKARIGLDATRTKVKVDVPASYVPGEALKVCAMYQAKSITGFFALLIDSRVLKSQVTMRIEQIDDVAPLIDLTETALAGQDWTWC